MENQEPKAAITKSNTVSLSFNLKYICVALLVIIVAMLALWRPWQVPATDSSRVVKVTGETKVTAKPDEFVFYPSYQFKNASKDMALAELTKKSDEVVKKLKELGVEDSKIKTNSNGWEGYQYFYDDTAKQATYMLTLTVTVGNKELAQKVQDYLVTTAPTGSVSPQAGFSDATRKKLEDKARDEATKDARAKAEQSAKNLGYKIGKVKSVDDNGGLGDIGGCRGTICTGAALSVAEDKAAPSLGVQAGENDLTYSVTVEYYIR